MYTLVCPKNVYHYFHHIIQSFQFELHTSNPVTELDSIWELNDKTILLFGVQELCKYSQYSTWLRCNQVCVYNTEQLQTGKWDYMIHASSYITEWWDYSNLNITYLIEWGFTKQLKHIYIGYSPVLDLDIQNEVNMNTIHFFGTHHTRREEWCTKLENKLEIPVSYDTSGTVVEDKYTSLLSTNGVYLNLHYYTPSILEIVRIVPLLCQGHLVISERSDDHELDRLFSPYVIWLPASTSELDEETVNYIRKQIQNHNRDERKERFKQELSFHQILKKSGILKYSK